MNRSHLSSYSKDPRRSSSHFQKIMRAHWRHRHWLRRWLPHTRYHLLRSMHPSCDIMDYSGSGDFTLKDHERLAECFKNAKAKCMMVVNDTEQIQALYDGFIAHEYGKKYSCKSSGGHATKETNHLIICNYIPLVDE